MLETDSIDDLVLDGQEFASLFFLKKIGESQFPVFLATDYERANTESAVKVFTFYPGDPNRARKQSALDKEVKALVLAPQSKSIVQFFACRKATMYYFRNSQMPTFFEEVHAKREAESQGLPLSDMARVHFSCVVMEYVRGGALDPSEYRQKAKTSPHEVCGELADVAQALAEMHKTFIHGDLKPENLLWDDDRKRIKVADFGLAKQIDDGSTSGAGAGTFPYMAPEIAGLEQSSREGDVYAFAATLYHLLTGERPFNVPVQSQGERVAWVSEHKFKDPRPNPLSKCSWMSRALANCIIEGMSVEKNGRPTMEQIAIRLKAEAKGDREQLRIGDALRPSFPEFGSNEPACQVSEYVIDPSTRFHALQQEAYWLLIKKSDQNENSVREILEAIADYTNGRFRFCEIYGSWTFLANFWCDPTVSLSGLWKTLSGRVDEARVMRCTPIPNLMELGEGFGKISKKLAPKKDLTAARHDIKVMCEAYESNTSRANEALAYLKKHKLAYETKKYFPRAKTAKNWVESFCFVTAPAELMKEMRSNPANAANLLSKATRELFLAIESLKKNIECAFVFERAGEPIAGLPAGRIVANPADLLITSFAKDHQSRYHVTRAVLKHWPRALPSSSAATGWYTFWRESSFPTSTDETAPIEAVPSAKHDSETAELLVAAAPTHP